MLKQQKQQYVRRPPSKNRIDTVINRVYGKANAHVRRNIAEVESSTQRSQTGLRSNPDHIVPYDDHPYARTSGSRRLEDGGSLFRPMRIHVVTEALELQRNALNSDKIDFVKNIIMPRTVEFWSSVLSVVPVSDNLKIDSSELSNRMFCGDSEFSKVPTEHMNDGVPDADIIFYVSAQPSTRFCGPSTLAVAVGCNFDQFDRPTAGAINFCLEQIELDDDGSASESIIQDNVDVAVHEAAHILGMSSNSYRFFYDSETGRPRTERPFSVTSVVCVDGQERSLILPDQNTLRFFVTGDGQRYASIVTPRVKTVTRNQFDCQALEGAQLENQPTGSQSCTGDHWEERLFYPESLTGVISPTTNILSPLTLALMEDSGWFKANYSQAHVSPWGHGVGCQFINEPCLVANATNDDDVVVPDYGKGYFCSKANSRGCSPAHTHKMACTIIDYSLYYPPSLPPPQFSYFPLKAAMGGPRQADFCPVYGSTYSGLSPEQLECGNAKNADSFNLFQEFYGDNSMCFETNTGAGRCHLAQCITSERVLKVFLRGEWETCEYDFQEITIKTTSKNLFEGKLRCPRLSAACPDLFCPVNCAGQGICNFNATDGPRCECFNSSDTSVGCTESLVMDGKYLEDSSMLRKQFNQGFFDPLVAVFVDHPDTWSTSSW
eukprot:CAMPEP_0172481188 /NCGR_PEP_ID=MMETSP1066-20121228/6856_1 /TAXON_ID=671091 /ORGANISM="Coscinodiscus wailesii, Strain CCMP2513" /LENGTH=661 /DNA_ID=CAMNT_0013243219 /DNA_START=114 /DNA_END=2096 /DNA_ORIENTATION=-